MINLLQICLDGSYFAIFRSIEQLLAFKYDNIRPRPVKFSLRFPKSDRLLVA